MRETNRLWVLDGSLGADVVFQEQADGRIEQRSPRLPAEAFQLRESVIVADHSVFPQGPQSPGIPTCLEDEGGGQVVEQFGGQKDTLVTRG